MRKSFSGVKRLGTMASEQLGCQISPWQFIPRKGILAAYKPREQLDNASEIFILLLKVNLSGSYGVVGPCDERRDYVYLLLTFIWNDWGGGIFNPGEFLNVI